MASSSHSNRRFKYDVFLSFRGEDTRYGFTSFLLNDLRRNSIVTFMDDDELGRGEEIALALLKAIEESRAAVIVFSKNYAASSWCLDELGKIMECHENHGLMVFPVFHGVDPSHINKHVGSFGDALAAHEKHPKISDKVLKWKAALSKAAVIAGYSTNKIREEAKLVGEIVGDILKRLTPIRLSLCAKGLVDIDSRIEEVKQLLFSGSFHVRILGIWGMGGIGKTTIARAVFEQIASQFEGSCFLHNVREVSEQNGGLDHLVGKLLSTVLGKGQSNEETNYVGSSTVLSMLCHKKVLIVLDDVSNLAQIKSLAGDRSWFGAESKILLISRDKQVLENFVDHTYEVKELHYLAALQLFSLNAFKLEEPPEDFMALCSWVLQYAKGNPLALEILGSFLYGRTKSDWESALNRLKKGPNKDIQNVLKISYDGLEVEEKDVFLHIACFFNGEHQDRVIQILDGFDLSTKIAIRTLIDKALINISYNHLEMHDLLQEMGRSIVRHESKNPGKRSRLWSQEDIFTVFNKNSGTEAIEGIFLDMSTLTRDLYLNQNVFSNMPNLKLLRFYMSHEGFATKSRIHLSQGLESLPSDLRYLDWYRYPLPSLPTNFDPVNLVELHLQYSSILQLWEGTKDLGRLREINLNHSRHLIEAPDISLAPNLRTVMFRGCESLYKLPSSMTLLRNHTHWNLKGCENRRSFPDGVDFPSLEILDLSGCSKLEQFPLVSRNMKRVDLNASAIRELPSSIRFLTGLTQLNLSLCKNIRSFPDDVDLPSLEILNLSSCSVLEQFPLVSRNVKWLDLDDTAIGDLPSSISFLSSLTHMSLAGCKNIRSFPQDVDLPSLEYLRLSRCSNLKQFPLVSLAVKELYLNGTAISEVPWSVECLSRIVWLEMSGCIHLKSLSSSICKLKSLEYLSLSNCSSFENFPEISEAMDNLSELRLDGTAIVNLQESWATLGSLKKLDIRNCSKLEKLSDDIKNLKILGWMAADGCNLSAVPNSLRCLSSICYLDLSGNNFERLPTDFNKCSMLISLHVRDCKRLQSLPELPLSLKFIEASDCISLETVSAFNPMSRLKKLGFANCFKLDQNSWTQNMAHVKLMIQHRLSIPVHFVCYPGSRIPDWFKYQCLGSSITFKLQQDWYNPRFSGFALCAVFYVKSWYSSDVLHMECKVHFVNNNGNSKDHIRTFGVSESWAFCRPKIGEQHVLLWYEPYLNPRKFLCTETVNGCIESCCNEISIEFTAQEYNIELENFAEVIKCGVFQIHDQDEYFSANLEIITEEADGEALLSGDGFNAERRKS